jgi:uridine kinase
VRGAGCGAEYAHFRTSALRTIILLMSKPVIIGVAGGTGSGKTTVVRKIADAIGDGQVSVIDHDRYYFDHPDLRLEDRAGLNFDHPAALDTDLLVEHVRVLRTGSPVDIPIYDFRRHVRQAATQTIPVRPAIIVEGILVFENAALRELMDVKVFVDADDDTRFIRRLQRDMRERGRTLDQVIDQWTTTVKPMHLEFIEPTKRYADIIVPQGGHNDVAIGMLLSLIRGLTASNDA